MPVIESIPPIFHAASYLSISSRAGYFINLGMYIFLLTIASADRDQINFDILL